MLEEGNFTFETRKVIDPGQLPPSRPTRKESSGRSRVRKFLFTDDDGDDEGAGLRERQASNRSSGSGESHEIEFTTSDDEVEDMDPESGAVARSHRETAREASMDRARRFATAMLAESDRRQSERSLVSVDSNSVRSTSAMQWPRRGRRDEFKGFRSSFQDEEVDLRSQSIEREDFIKSQSRKRYTLFLRLAIAIIGLSILLCFSLVARTAVKSIRKQPAPAVGRLEDSERWTQALQVLAESGISRRVDLVDSSTAQYKALEWLTMKDEEMLEIPGVDAVARQRFVQRYSLAVLYFAWGGSEWNRSLGFISRDHECGWFEPSTNDSGETVAHGVSCDELLNVRSLLIPSNNLKGPIPEEIGHLESLKLLDLQENAISGEIPNSVEQLSKLEFFDVNRNRLAGTIPAVLGQLTGLKVLGMGRNHLLGTLPKAIERLTALKTLSIDNNILTGNLESMAALVNLQYLYAENNYLQGSLSDDFLESLYNLEELDLSGNLIFSEGVSPVLFSFPRLRVLDLHDNQIKGNFPVSVSGSPVLEFLSLRGNEITSSIPSYLDRLEKLTHLDLEGNYLTGTVPAETLSKMTSLYYLFLGKNPLTRGPVPDAFNSLKSLRELSLDNAHLTGTIPTWIGKLSELRLLDMRSNSLTGSIPATMANLEQMTYLLLNENLLTGSVPDNLGSTSSLRVASFHHNGIRGDMGQLCHDNSGIKLLTVDCEAVTCPCCDECCESEECFDDILWDTLEKSKGSWEMGFERSDYGFDPHILYAAELSSDTKDHQ